MEYEVFMMNSITKKFERHKKEIVKLSECVELHIVITPEMLKDFKECEAAAAIAKADCKDCGKCSLCNKVASSLSLCEIPEVAKILKKLM